MAANGLIGINSPLFRQFLTVRLSGITGRHIFAAWYKAARFLQSGLLDPSPIIMHRFPLGSSTGRWT
jgi:hypothetical protein